MNGQVMAIAATLAALYFAGVGIVDGVRWTGHEVEKGAKKAGHAIVHVLAKVPHPHHRKKDDGA